MTQKHWKRLNTLQHYKVPGGPGLGGGLSQGRGPATAHLPTRSRMEPLCGSSPSCTTEVLSPRAWPRTAPWGRVSPVAPELEAGGQESQSRRLPRLGVPHTLSGGKPNL